MKMWTVTDSIESYVDKSKGAKKSCIRLYTHTNTFVDVHSSRFPSFPFIRPTYKASLKALKMWIEKGRHGKGPGAGLVLHACNDAPRLMHLSGIFKVNTVTEETWELIHTMTDSITVKNALENRQRPWLLLQSSTFQPEIYMRI